MEIKFEIENGYWEEEYNDGRHICHQEKPEWWNYQDAPAAHHGYAARLLPADGNYGWQFGETINDAIKACLFYDDGEPIEL